MFTLDGKDVTRTSNQSGASYLVDLDRMRILLFTKNVHPQRALMSLAMALNEMMFTGNLNSMCLEKMIDAEPSEIPDLLSFLRVSRGVEDAFLGTKLNGSIIERLHPFN